MTDQDISVIARITKRFKLTKVSYLQVIAGYCFSVCFRKLKKRQKYLVKATERLENELDVKNLAETSINLRLILKNFLNKRQILLFKY